jgi:hypothetical protein
VQPVSGGGNNRRNRIANTNHINRNAEEEACARELLELQQQQEEEQHYQIKLEDSLVDMNDNGVVTFATCSSPGKLAQLYNICIAITRDKFVYLSRLKIKNN